MQCLMKAWRRDFNVLGQVFNCCDVTHSFVFCSHAWRMTVVDEEFWRWENALPIRGIHPLTYWFCWCWKWKLNFCPSYTFFIPKYSGKKTQLYLVHHMHVHTAYRICGSSLTLFAVLFRVMGRLDLSRSMPRSFRPAYCHRHSAVQTSFTAWA